MFLLEYKRVVFIFCENPSIILLQISIHTIPYILQGCIVRIRPTISKIIAVARRVVDNSNDSSKNLTLFPTSLCTFFITPSRRYIGVYRYTI